MWWGAERARTRPCPLRRSAAGAGATGMPAAGATCHKVWLSASSSWTVQGVAVALSLSAWSRERISYSRSPDSLCQHSHPGKLPWPTTSVAAVESDETIFPVGSLSLPSSSTVIRWVSPLRGRVQERVSPLRSIPALRRSRTDTLNDRRGPVVAGWSGRVFMTV